MSMFLKLIHIITAVLSITGFVIRGYLRLINSPFLGHRWIRIAPHVVDTLLLISAIILALQLSQAPLLNTWLTAKVAALLVYILLGFIVMRLAKRQDVRIFAYLLAIITFAYIAAVALTRNVFLF